MCVTIAATTTMAATAFDNACFSSSSAGVVTLLGDYLGVTTAGAPVVDTTNTQSWDAVAAGTVAAWNGGQGQFTREITPAESAEDYTIVATTAFKMAFQMWAVTTAPTAWTTSVGSCDITLNAYATAPTLTCTGWTSTTTTSGAMSVVAPFAALAYVVAALF